MRFHVGPNGPGKCSALKGQCPFGGDSEHYYTQRAAEIAYEQQMIKETISRLTKESLKLEDEFKFEQGLSVPDVTPGEFKSVLDELESFHEEIAIGDIVFVRTKDKFGLPLGWKGQFPEPNFDDNVLTVLSIERTDGHRETNVWLNSKNDNEVKLYQGIGKPEDENIEVARALLESERQLQRLYPELVPSLEERDTYEDHLRTVSYGEFELGNYTLRNTGSAAPEIWETNLVKNFIGLEEIYMRERNGIASLVVVRSDGKGRETIYSRGVSKNGSPGFPDNSSKVKFFMAAENRLRQIHPEFFQD